MKKLNTRGFTIVEGLLILLIVGIIGGVGYYVWQSKQSADDSLNKASSQGNASSNKITSFDDCKKVKSSRLQETYPETCVTSSGKKFTNPDQPALSKTYKSPLSGLTIKYPDTWIVNSKNDIFTNNGGGKSVDFMIFNIERTGSYGGQDANTYMCVSVGNYTIANWTYASDKLKGLSTLATVRPNSNTTLDLSYQKADQPMLGALYLTKTGNQWIKTDATYQFKASADFNCGQGDYHALESSKEDFLKRPEVAIAKAILESIKY